MSPWWMKEATATPGYDDPRVFRAADVTIIFETYECLLSLTGTNQVAQDVMVTIP